MKTHLLHALDVEPDNWNMLNNYGVWLWKQAQEQDVKRAQRRKPRVTSQTAKACQAAGYRAEGQG